jgi:hypothetical protein
LKEESAWATICTEHYWASALDEQRYEKRKAVFVA